MIDQQIDRLTAHAIIQDRDQAGYILLASACVVLRSQMTNAEAAEILREFAEALEKPRLKLVE